MRYRHLGSVSSNDETTSTSESTFVIDAGRNQETCRVIGDVVGGAAKKPDGFVYERFICYPTNDRVPPDAVGASVRESRRSGLFWRSVESGVGGARDSTGSAKRRGALCRQWSLGLMSASNAASTVGSVGGAGPRPLRKVGVSLAALSTGCESAVPVFWRCMMGMCGGPLINGNCRFGGGGCCCCCCWTEEESPCCRSGCRRRSSPPSSSSSFMTVCRKCVRTRTGLNSRRPVPLLQPPLLQPQGKDTRSTWGQRNGVSSPRRQGRGGRTRPPRRVAPVEVLRVHRGRHACVMPV
ncbi:hypothetical protein EYF80_028294 [Liparis tanakae]|uniref:Uncharacterized protein n=1 Tax=Liparis tanakae TaxID=230148 RepID=A0A4Z2H6X6_9TELE|nr:hypothetical protein EYF80_028294 [Liparis tanakae]